MSESPEAMGTFDRGLDDQPYREYDLAIDFREDMEPLGREATVRVKDIFEEAGARARISSIHVNGWYGEFDKLSTARLWAVERLGVDIDAERERFVYCGDSPNDEPMLPSTRHGASIFITDRPRSRTS